MTANSFFGRNLLSNAILCCAEKVEYRMVEAGSGLYVVFESAPIVWPGENRMTPFYVARHDYDRDGPEAGTPDPIKDHLSSPGWTHFIWLPFEVAQGNCGQFTIRYAHELQHYRQVLNPQFSRDALKFLRALKQSGYVATLNVEGSRVG